jgi:hypothetical protein
VLYASMIYFGVPFIGKFLGLYFPLALTRGYFKSAESGLWNIAQGGLWDVDGSGIKPIQDINTAQAILNKVNKMNVEIGVQAAVISLVLSTLAQLVHQ